MAERIPIEFIGVFAIGAHVLLFLCIVIACFKKYCCERRTKTRSFPNNNTFSDVQRAMSCDSNRLISTISDGVLHDNQASTRQSNVHMSPTLLDALVHGYHASSQSRAHFATPPSSDRVLHRLSSTESFDQYSDREESSYTPISPPSPRNTEEEGHHMMPFVLTEFPDDGFEDWPDEPPPSYNSLFEIVRPADDLFLK
ncbi:uncharacterized protein LOC133194509 [Saccostrea echinata]|uniref:uncharacterized protein LOC133194509 n=1 Tax=Saccostrea echinata TaxID=191078 RepID=UPI002A7F4987|nr:uncharacterized protein LOC133194509 [Saccostrea echinata]